MNRLALVLVLPLAVFPQSAEQIMQDVQTRSRATSQHYEGKLKVVDAKSKVTEKSWIYDRFGSHGASKAVLRFTVPAEVKGVALLVLNHPDRASDQWMWTPAINRERRIAMQDRSTRFFGTDFSFEDLEERDVQQYDYKLLGEEACTGGVCWKIESSPKQTKSSQYTRSFVWVRKDIYVPARIESFRKDTLVRRLEYADFENVAGIWTARKLDMLDVARNSHTILTLDKLRYNVPMKEEDFTLQALRRPS